MLNEQLHCLIFCSPLKFRKSQSALVDMKKKSGFSSYHLHIIRHLVEKPHNCMFLVITEGLLQMFFTIYMKKWWQLLQEAMAWWFEFNSLRLRFLQLREHFSPRQIIPHSSTMVVRSCFSFHVISTSTTLLWYPSFGLLLNLVPSLYNLFRYASNRNSLVISCYTRHSVVVHLLLLGIFFSLNLSTLCAASSFKYPEYAC